MTLPTKTIVLEDNQITIGQKSGMDLFHFTNYIMATLSLTPGFYAGSIVAIGHYLLNSGFQVGSKEKEEITKFQIMFKEEKIGLLQSMIQSFLAAKGTNKEAMNEFINQILSCAIIIQANSGIKLSSDNIGNYLKDFTNIYKLLWEILRFQYEDLITRFLV